MNIHESDAIFWYGAGVLGQMDRCGRIVLSSSPCTLWSVKEGHFLLKNLTLRKQTYPRKTMSFSGPLVKKHSIVDYRCRKYKKLNTYVHACGHANFYQRQRNSWKTWRLFGGWGRQAVWGVLGRLYWSEAFRQMLLVLHYHQAWYIYSSSGSVQ